MSNYSTIKKPLNIGFRNNVDGYINKDFSKYITNLTVNMKVEDEPFVFVENEIRIDFWDFDGGFIRKTGQWSNEINELEIFINTNSETLFKGYLEIPEVLDKRTALSFDEKSNTGSLYFGSGIERYNSVIEKTYNLTANDPLGLGSADALSKIYPQLTKISDLMKEISKNENIFISYNALPIFNSNFYCYHYLNEAYFYADETSNKQRTTLEFLKDIAKLYDCYLNYDSVNGKLVYYRRENLEGLTFGSLDSLEDLGILEFKKTGKIPEYTGVSISNLFPRREYSDVVNRKLVPYPLYVKYDKNGEWEFTHSNIGKPEKKPYRIITKESSGEVTNTKVETAFIPNANKETFFFGETDKPLNIDLDVLGYLETKTDLEAKRNPPDRINDSWFPNAELRKEVRENIFNGVLRYLKPSVEYNLKTRNLPEIAEVFKYLTLNSPIPYAGYIQEVEYNLSSGNMNQTKEQIDVTWKQIFQYQAEKFETGAK